MKMKQFFSAATLTVAGAMLFAAPAQADYGYEDTFNNDCSSREAWTETTGTTISNYITRVSATATTMTFYLEPSYDNANCDVKMPIGYTDFEGIEIGMTSNIQTSPGQEEIRRTVNATGNGQITVTATGLDPATEYQIRARNIYTKDNGATEYGSTTKNHYFSTNSAAVSSPRVTENGTVKWTWPAGPAANLKARVTVYKRVRNTFKYQDFTVKYKTGATNNVSSYEFDSIGNLSDGDYYVLITPSKKSSYDGVDMELYGVQPKIVAFRVVNGNVKTAKNRVLTPTASQVYNCLATTSDCTINSNISQLSSLVKPERVSRVSRAKKKSAAWTSTVGASFYKVQVTTKSGKNKFLYRNVSGTSKTFKKNHRRKLKSGKTYIVKVRACNNVGCGKWRGKRFTVN